MRKNMGFGREFADTVALKALGWLVAQEEILPVFLGASGTAPAELRERAGEPDFLLSVLDFIVMDDAWVTAFCDAAGLDYSAPMTARAALPGGGDMSWT